MVNCRSLRHLVRHPVYVRLRRFVARHICRLRVDSRSHAVHHWGMMKFTLKTSLNDRGPIDSLPDRPVGKHTLLVAEKVATFATSFDRAGHDMTTLMPAVHDGMHCFLRKDVWVPAHGYSAEGACEEIISIEEGVRLMMEHGCLAHLWEQE